MANAGATTINVQSTTGWAVGQTLGIAPSFSNFDEYEKVVITSLTPTSVTFSPALKFAHYGSSSPLTNSYGSLDMRAIVGVLNRNIRILRDDTAQEWGGSVIIYGYKEANNVHSGSAAIDSVQFQSGGQFDSERAALNVLGTATGSSATTATNSAFENCLGQCVYIRDAKNLNVNRNFFFEGQNFLVYTENTESYTFTHNVMIGARNRSGSTEGDGDTIACFNQQRNHNATNDVVQDNICQGSQGAGFIIPWTSCGHLSQESGYVRNTAGSADIGFVLIDQNLLYQCKTAGHLRAYGCNIGITSNPHATRV